jgi:hypothetical protein
MLDFFENWAAGKMMEINDSKTVVVEFCVKKGPGYTPGTYVLRNSCGVRQGLTVANSFLYLGIPMDEDLSMDVTLKHVWAQFSAAHGRAETNGLHPAGLALRDRLVAWAALVRPHMEWCLPFLSEAQVKKLEPLYSASVLNAFAPEGVARCVYASTGIPTLNELHAAAVLRLFGQVNLCPEGRLPKLIHEEAKERGTPGGLETRFKTWLDKLWLDGVWPNISLRNKSGKVSSVAASKDRFKTLVKEAVADRMRPFQAEGKPKVSPGGNIAAYMRIAGEELERPDGLKAERWMFSGRSAWALQKTLERRTQGSWEIACHCPWKLVEGTWERIPYNLRVCAHCRERGETHLGDEAHWLLHCQRNSAHREALSTEATLFFQHHRLNFEGSGVQAQWADLQEQAQVGLLLGSILPPGHVVHGTREGEWMKQWVLRLSMGI